ncbi:MAG: ABC transporter ATP-binding protein [Hirschia sp.]|nr:ABC transporter ATP-binding protein [Hirschia sp.]MBF17903.1 ABC transporter ATP-binding protein [Hirschia sp.]
MSADRQNILYTIRSGCALAKPYFRSEERWLALRLLAGALACALVIVGTSVLFTYWQRGLFNALEQKDWPAFLSLLLSWDISQEGVLTIGFTPLLVVYVLASIYGLYLRQRLQLSWRTWMTTDIVGRYLTERSYYLLELREHETDNPDQRISEDINLFTQGSLEMGVGLFQTMASMISFVVLLWSLSSAVSFFGWTVPGSLVWIALLYAIAGTAITHFMGRRLVDLHFRQQRFEADFRAALMRLREHAEGVAFYRGEAREQKELTGIFENVWFNFLQIVNLTKRVTLSVTGLAQANLVIPLIIAAPAYFAGKIPLGSVFQTANALNKVVENLSWFVENYTKLTSYSATIDRLERFCAAVDQAQHTESHIEFSTVPRSDALACKNLTLLRPGGEVLFDQVSFDVQPREWVLLRGRSGTGKTSLLKGIAGLWPYGDGQIAVPEGTQMFIPQRPYLPNGRLDSLLKYPSFPHDISREDVEAVFSRLCLSHLLAFQDRSVVWLSRLSGGEVQRLAIARLVLQRPALAFLDEVTSQLDPELEQEAYTLMKQRLRDTTVISVAHRTSLDRFHGRSIVLQDKRLVEWAVEKPRADFANPES